MLEVSYDTVRLLHVPEALPPEEPRCAARADPYRREALRLLHVPTPLQRQEQRCAARADPTPLTEIVERKGVKSNAPVIPAFNFYYLFIHTNFE